MRTLGWVLVGLFAAVLGAIFFLQRETTANLRNEIALLRDEQREVATLRAEHQRLTAAQPPASELERLRADRAALDALRTEIQSIRERVEQAEHREEALTSEATASARLVMLDVAMDANGALSLEGRPGDLSALRQRLSQLGAGAPVEIRMSVAPSARAENVKAAVDGIMALQKELGLKLKLRLDQRAPASQ